MTAGHSLGEFSALVANETLRFEDALKLVYKRALAMQKACELRPSTMAAVLGLDDEKVEEVCASITDDVVEAANYNCLTRFDRGTNAVQIVPTITPNGPTTVGYPNTNQNMYYYGDLTGLCWVQGFHKVYTAYGGQVHAFNTADGSEINNSLIAVQGTALDVAYLDAIADTDN